MLKKVAILIACIASFAFAEMPAQHANMSASDANVSNSVNVSLTKNLKVNRQLTPLARRCVECHAEKTPGVVADWKMSRHAHVGVSCTDCHSQPADSPMAAKEPHPKDTDNHISVLVSPKTCAKCHSNEVKEFENSGHARGAMQMQANKGMVDLMYHYEGRDIPDLKHAPDITGCSQCHGSVIKMDEHNKPTKETWPVYGIGTVYPDGSVGGCKSCHSSHKFSIAEARKPAACASCHLGPDHPDIEIYNNSMHGHVFNAEGNEWKFDSAPGTWAVPDYRAPTCATCHISGGVGDLNSTHNVSQRLKWNLWLPKSNLRTGGNETAVSEFLNTGKLNIGNPLAGNLNGPEAARAEMKQVCKECHASTHTNNFFEAGDKQVLLYNVYNDEATKMLKELKEKKLLKDDPWADAFQRIYYTSWHHEGRRMRQGALMGGPDYSHWHGVFEVKNDIREMREIYERRIKTGKIEE